MFKQGLKFHQDKNYDEMKKMYLEAINKENSAGAIYNLAHYYYYNENNTNNAKKYLVIGVNNQSAKCAFFLGKIYDNENDRTNAIKYYKIAIKYGYCRENYIHNDTCKGDYYMYAMDEICEEYFLEGREYERTRKIDLATKYYEKSIKYGSCEFHSKKTLLYLDILNCKRRKRINKIF